MPDTTKQEMKIPEDWYLVSSGSDGALCLLVQWHDLRAAIHEVFCCCKDATCNAGGYLDDWDDYCEEQQREGAHWDLEDGWVKVELLGATPKFWPEPQPASPPDHAPALTPKQKAAEEMYEALKAWEKWYSEDSTQFNRDMAQGMGLAALSKAGQQ